MPKRVTTVFVSYAGSLCDRLQDGLASLVDLIVWAGGGAIMSAREWNDI
jgi:hypothetical protein